VGLRAKGKKGKGIICRAEATEKKGKSKRPKRKFVDEEGKSAKEEGWLEGFSKAFRNLPRHTGKKELRKGIPKRETQKEEVWLGVGKMKEELGNPLGGARKRLSQPET